MESIQDAINHINLLYHSGVIFSITDRRCPCIVFCSDIGKIHLEVEALHSADKA